MLNDAEPAEKGRGRESVDVVKYESGPDGGEEVSMSVEWNGVSTAQGLAPSASPRMNDAVSRSVLCYH